MAQQGGDDNESRGDSSMPDALSSMPSLSSIGISSSNATADDDSTSTSSNLLHMPQRTYPVAVVARRLGIAPATLRTWARRHGLSASGQTAGGHRRYTDVDVARLQRVQQLYASGTPLDAAAEIALTETPQQLQAALAVAVGAVAESANTTHVDFSSSGHVRELILAAVALNASACRRIVDTAVEARGVVSAWDDVILPALIEVGSRWESTGGGVEVEHLLSHCIAASLSSHSHLRGEPLNARPVLLACAPKELHALPVLAIHAALAEQQIEARVLGEQTPTDALVHAVERIGPAAVVVWAQLPENADAQALTEIPTMRPPVAVIAAGPGWAPESLGETGRLVSLTHTVRHIAHALRL